MSNLDDLRNWADDEDDESSSEDDFDFDNTAVLGNEGNTLFLGMTAVERMFISMFLFMNVAVLGLALLLATGRIGG